MLLASCIHRNSLLLSHLLTLAPSQSCLCPPASHKHGLMHRDIPRTHDARAHTDTQHLWSSLARGKVCLESIALLCIHWPLVVNNDMTHPVHVSMMRADGHAKGPATWISMPPPLPHKQTPHHVLFFPLKS